MSKFRCPTDLEFVRLFSPVLYPFLIITGPLLQRPGNAAFAESIGAEKGFIMPRTKTSATSVQVKPHATVAHLWEDCAKELKKDLVIYHLVWIIHGANIRGVKARFVCLTYRPSTLAEVITTVLGRDATSIKRLQGLDAVIVLQITETCFRVTLSGRIYKQILQQLDKKKRDGSSMYPPLMEEAVTRAKSSERTVVAPLFKKMVENIRQGIWTKELEMVFQVLDSKYGDDWRDGDDLILYSLKHTFATRSKE